MLDRRTKIRIALRKHNGLSSEDISDITGIRLSDVRTVICDMVIDKELKKHTCEHCRVGLIYELFQ